MDEKPESARENAEETSDMTPAETCGAAPGEAAAAGAESAPLSPGLAREARSCFSRVGWTYFLIFGAAVLAQLGLLAAARAWAPALLESDWSIWIAALAPIYLIGLPLGWRVLRRLPADAPRAGALGFGGLLRFLAMSVTVMYLGNILGLAVNFGLSALLGKTFSGSPLAGLLQGTDLWKNVLFVVLLAPAMEELIFRKLLCDRIRVYGEKTAILVSGLVFGLYHGNLSQFFYAAGLGMIFAYVYLRTGRLRYTIILHSVINFLGGVASVFLLQNVDLEQLTQLGQYAAGDTRAMLEILRKNLLPLIGLSAYGSVISAMFIVGLVFLISGRKKAVFLPAERELPRTGRAKLVLANPGMLAYALCTVGFMVYVVLKGA